MRPITSASLPGGRAEAPDAEHSRADLRRRLAVVEARVRATVAHRRAADPDPDDGFRGLYIADGHADRLLAGDWPPPAPPESEEAARLADDAERRADDAEAAGTELRLRRLADGFGLDALDVEVLLIALVVDLDPRFERLYGYLNDDVSRRRATVALALELAGALPAEAESRRRLGATAPLVAGGLIEVEEGDRPLLGRALRVPDRVVAHLLGDDTVDPILTSLLITGVVMTAWRLPQLERGLAGRTGLCYVRDRRGRSGVAAATTALHHLGRPAVICDPQRLGPRDDPAEIARVAARDARLIGGGLVVTAVDALAETSSAAVRAFAEAPGVRVLVGTRAWSTAWARAAPLLIDAPAVAVDEQAALWLAFLDDLDADDPAGVVAPYRLAPEQVRAAAAAARLQAEAAGRSPTADDLQAGARAQNAAGLERLARRIQPVVGWDDLVLPADTLAELRELTARTRHRDQVLDAWCMGTSSRGRGVAALFAGDSGTGKTLSAEVIAAELGLDLYVIDLSSVIDKYIGETEKNLDRIFTEAEGVNGVLLFDEADALFGKRGDAQDAHDRYANVEVAYLLQRMEHFDGIAILTTNLRSNLDEAFTRRLDAIVGFPAPEPDDRRRLWRSHLRPPVPRDPDVDVDFLADTFQLSGGEIRNVCVTAAYLAVDAGRAVTMADLVRATAREYDKLGRVCLEAEFGPWFHVVSSLPSR